jgi:hypothetical protein
MGTRVGLEQLARPIYLAAETISQEMIGFIPAVTRDMTTASAAIGETVYMPVSASAVATDIVPGTSPPDDGDNEIGHVELKIDKMRRVPVRISGDQERILDNSFGWEEIRAYEFAQAMRTLVAEIEADLAMMYMKASRAYGTAGVTPFGSASRLADVAYAKKILDDNGAPMSDRQLVINTSAGVNLALLTQLTNVADAGTSDLLRRGIISSLFGFSVRQSSAIKTHSGGTGAGYLIDLVAGYPAKSTSLHIDSGTAGATGIVAGDVIAIDGDTEGGQYIVSTGTATAEADIEINSPGLMSSVANNAAISLAGSYQANLAFSRSAIYLATRAPYVPSTGDKASDSMVVTDPVSGLTFEVREYPGYRQTQFEVGIAWGAACVKPEHCCVIMG